MQQKINHGKLGLLFQKILHRYYLYSFTYNNSLKLAEAFGKEITDISLIQIFSTLLKDSENDVRIAAVQSLGSFIKLINTEKLNLLVPQIQVLARDNSNTVKTIICDVMASIVTLVGKDISIQKLFPYLLEIVDDKDPDVRIS